MSQLSSQEVDLLKAVCLKRGIAFTEIRNSRTLNHCCIDSMDEFVAALIDRYHSIDPIVIVGDYDVDGAVSTALLLRGLRAFGFKNVSYMAPQRFGEGYGLSPELMQRLSEKFSKNTGTIITVDNGVRAFEGTQIAKNQGWTVFITDHHLPEADRLPPADIIVNPKVGGEKSALNLAGVGVVFYCLKTLHHTMKQKNMISIDDSVKSDPEQWLDLVALGSIADVVPLDATNRALTMRGLQLMRKGAGTAGVQALLKHVGYRQGKVGAHWISARVLSCQVAPLINAAGRMDDISIAIELLVSDEPTRLNDLLKTLEALNRKRKKLQEQMLQEALSKISPDDDRAAITLFDENWHSGILGILASQVKARYQKPAAIFCKISDNVWRGSVRSTSNRSLISFLTYMKQHHHDQVLQSGGHAFAAGMTVTDEGLQAFSKSFSDYIKNSKEEVLRLDSDGELADSLISLRTVQLLNYWIPWGAECEEPCFEGDFFVLNVEKLGKEGLKLLVRPANGTTEISAITFTGLPQPFKGVGIELELQTIRLFYRIGMNFFAGVSRLQLYIEKMQHVR